MSAVGEIAGLRQQVVDALVKVAPRGWKRLFVDYEFWDRPDSFVSCEVMMAVVKPLLKPPRLVRVDPTDLAYSPLFRELAKAELARLAKNPFTLELIVRSARDHHWNVVVDSAPRLKSTFDGDLEYEYRHPEVGQRYRTFAADDEWLARIPRHPREAVCER